MKQIESWYVADSLKTRYCLKRESGACELVPTFDEIIHFQIHKPLEFLEGLQK